MPMDVVPVRQHPHVNAHLSLMSCHLVSYFGNYSLIELLSLPGCWGVIDFSSETFDPQKAHNNLKNL